MFRISHIFVAAIFLAGCTKISCDKPAPPPPDGSSGLQGSCLLSAEGKAGERQHWPNVRIDFTPSNNGILDTSHLIHAMADEQGRFRVPMNPGEYLVGLSDLVRLKGKAHGYYKVKVEPGRFSEIVIDWDKMNIRDWQEAHLPENK